MNTYIAPKFEIVSVDIKDIIQASGGLIDGGGGGSLPSSPPFGSKSVYSNE